MLFGWRQGTKTGRNVNQTIQSTEQTKNDADTNYLNREGLQVSTWKNLKDARTTGKYFHLNEDQDNADTQKTDQFAS